MTTPDQAPSVLLSMSTSAAAPAIAAFFTNPADVAKTRLNMMRELQPGRIGSVLSCWKAIYSVEGVAGLQRGLGFVLIRESSKNAFRLGLYDPLIDLPSARSSQSKEQKLEQKQRRGSMGTGASMDVRIAAGALSGGFSALIANPLDLLKTRLQLDPSRDAGNSATDALRRFVQAEGVLALWQRGALANVCRSALATSLGLPINSKLKEFANDWQLFGRAAIRDAVCALGASAFVVLAINPIDLVRTRLFASAASGGGGGSTTAVAQYDGVLHTIKRVAAAEGIGGFWKGTQANFLRIGPHQTITFVMVGVLQRLAQSR